MISVIFFSYSDGNEVWENMGEGKLTRTKEMLNYTNKREGYIT